MEDNLINYLKIHLQFVCLKLWELGDSDSLVSWHAQLVGVQIHEKHIRWHLDAFAVEE